MGAGPRRRASGVRGTARLARRVRLGGHSYSVQSASEVLTIARSGEVRSTLVSTTRRDKDEARTSLSFGSGVRVGALFPSSNSSPRA